MIRRLLRGWRIWSAQRKLQRLIDQRARSYEVESYRRHRAAALKATRG